MDKDKKISESYREQINRLERLIPIYDREIARKKGQRLLVSFVTCSVIAFYIAIKDNTEPLTFILFAQLFAASLAMSAFVLFAFILAHLYLGQNVRESIELDNKQEKLELLISIYDDITELETENQELIKEISHLKKKLHAYSNVANDLNKENKELQDKLKSCQTETIDDSQPFDWE